MKALLRCLFLVVIASTVSFSTRGQEPDYCSPDHKSLSQIKTTALVQKTEPIVPPTADGLRIKGFVSLRTEVDQEGTPIRIRAISGHPLMFGAAIESVKHWKFRPLIFRGIKKRFCGRITIRFEATSYAVKYKLA